MIVAAASWYQELIDWLGSLEPDFAFLLALPFMVALAGLAGEYVRGRLYRRGSDTHHERPSR